MSGPFGPSPVSDIPTNGANAVATSGAHVYIAESNGLRILDAATSTSPEQVGFVEIPGLSDVEVSGGYAFVASEDRIGLHVVDVGDPWSPVQVWSEDLDGYDIQDIEVAGNHWFVADALFRIHLRCE